MNLRVSRSLTMALAGICGFLLVLVVLFWFGVGRGYSWWPLDPLDEAAGKKKLVNAQYRLGAWDNFAELNARPLFNEDRRPTPPMPADGPNVAPIPKLDVILSGVIITSKVRMALVKEKGKEKAMTVKEGGSMPGEWSAWSLAEVKPRGAVFKNSAGESATVELIPVASSQKPTPPPPPRTSAPAPATPGQPPQAGQPQQVLPPPGLPVAPEAAAATADLQQRIDARRQQIREQQQQQQQQPPQQPPPESPQPVQQQ